MSWSHEHEQRLFVPLAYCEMAGAQYFWHVSGPPPEQIVLGVRCRLTAFDVVRAMRQGSRQDAQTEVFRARLDPTMNRLMLNPEASEP
jgi:hypothetical protein